MRLSKQLGMLQRRIKIHCDCCDVLLTDYESSIRFVDSGMYASTCLKCLSGLGLKYKGNKLLLSNKTVDDEHEQLVKDFLDLNDNEE